LLTNLKRNILKEFPEDVDVADKYAFDFNGFIYPGNKSTVVCMSFMTSGNLLLPK